MTITTPKAKPLSGGDKLATALWELLRSPNEADSNGEAANVVDGLFAVARAIERHARVQVWLYFTGHGAEDLASDAATKASYFAGLH